MLEKDRKSNTKMIEERLSICKKCGIYNTSQEMCSSILYINPETNDVSLYQKDGYFKGCGCYCPMKAKRGTNHCPAGKW